VSRSLAVDFTVNKQLVFNGVVTGVTYGVLAVGLVLVYRSARVINFAQGEMGAFGAALLVLLVINYDVPFFVALGVVVVVGAVLGAVIELVIVRRLFRAPRVILFVATIGAAQLIFLFQFLLPGLDRFGRYPTPFRSTWEVGGVLVRSEHLLILLVIPVMTAALAFFLERTRAGTAVRAAAANPDAARTSTIRVKRMSTLVWVLAGLLATVSAVLVAPLQGASIATVALGPALLLRALAAALVARMTSLPIALGAGVVIGVAEALLFFNYPAQPGLIDAVLFVVVLVAVLAIARASRGEDKATSWSFAPRTRPVPARLRDHWIVRNTNRAVAAVVLVVAILLPVIVDTASRHFLYSRMLLFAIVALSLTVLTGWAGQLSLGQFAFVGLGAMTTVSLVGNGLSFELAVPLATVLTVVAALVVGAPALRVRGLFLAVTTLAFAVMTASWLLRLDVFTGGDAIVTMRRARWGDSFSLGPQRTYYYLCLAVLVVMLVLAVRIRRSGLGRSMIAVRDNPEGAAAFTISPTRIKLIAFGVAGGMAGAAGGLLAGLLQTFGTDAFSPADSLRVVAMAVIGGLSSVAGAVMGAVWVIGLPALFDNAAEVRLLTSGAGLLILLLYFPGGFIELVYRVRDAGYELLARRLPARPITKDVQAPVPVTVRAGGDARPVAPDGVVLRTREVRVRFGGRMAVDGVDLEVRAGEVVGLIGTNGAGKSTLMNAAGGFVRSSGTVELLGEDVSGLSSARRARRGLGRTFQSPELFPDLSVRETVQVALEARHRATLPATLLSLPRARRGERAKRAQAEELIAFFGLGRYGDTMVSELSTGTRRVVELACLVALESRVLCLDEPTAGVAQRETEAFAPLVRRIRDELDASMLVIEHDMPFIMGISDRVYCLETGRIIAEGSPHEVRHDPSVIASYLGTDERAIARSGTAAADTRRATEKT
jgi:ABC-type branched-subunit amino acid transport system ATPase component/ABC-type branched-subunit amino acid transport system permease subunit